MNDRLTAQVQYPRAGINESPSLDGARMGIPGPL